MRIGTANLDGHLHPFRYADVAVVGGGDMAMNEAIIMSR